MKVIIATSSTPFVYGGAALLVTWLEESLKNRGHEVETYRIPVYSSSDDLSAQMVGMRMWDFTGHGDRMIAVRTPSYLIRHHSKVAWFLHHHRPSYDLWDSHRDVRDDADGREFRRMNFVSDEVALAECEAIFTNSAEMSRRLRHYNNIESEVLYPPLGEEMFYEPGPFGDSIVYVSRMVPHKRQMLALRALAHTKHPVRLVLAGSDSGSGYAGEMFAEIGRLDLSGRVTLLNNVISEDTKRNLMADSLGIAYIPEMEDSYGYVGLEAVAARKPLVTVSDSGGVLELVQDGVNGFITDPTPEGLAEAFDKLYADRDLAARMGAAQQTRVDELNISWDHCISRLLA